MQIKIKVIRCIRNSSNYKWTHAIDKNGQIHWSKKIMQPVFASPYGWSFKTSLTENLKCCCKMMLFSLQRPGCGPTDICVELADNYCRPTQRCSVCASKYMQPG